jgi:DNA excision repair protein ERCC-3
MKELLLKRGLSRAWESGQKLLSIMNPNKFRAAEFLLRHHEARGDKVLMFSDTIHALTTYCELLGVPNLWGATDNKVGTTGA